MHTISARTQLSLWHDYLYQSPWQQHLQLALKTFQQAVKLPETPSSTILDMKDPTYEQQQASNWPNQ